jgi:hypothetical protein
MLTVQVQGLDALVRNFESLGRELPKAIARGLNKGGESLIERERLEMQNSIKSGPVPFTLNSHGQWKAQGQAGRLDTVIFVKDKQAEYLQGPTQGKPFTGLAPGPAARLNAYGNLIGKKGGIDAIRGKLRADGEFIGRVKGVAKRGRYAGQAFDKWGRWARWPRRKGQPDSLSLVAYKVIDQDRNINLRWNEVAADWANRRVPDYIRTELELALALYGRRARV